MTKPTLTQSDLTHEFTACWLAVLDTTPAEVRDTVADIIARKAAHLAEVFYCHLQASPRAKPFLEHDVVNRRLRSAMRHWMLQTLSGARNEEVLGAMIARQIELGAIHARIRMPIDLMTRGTQVLLDEFHALMATDALPVDRRFDMYRYVVNLFSLCDELMTISYVTEMQRATRVDESYHLLAQRREATIERERQRALISEWAQSTLFAISTSARRGTAVPISSSDFGVWMTHKASLFFDDDADLGHVRELMTHIDDALLPQLKSSTVEPEAREKLIESLATKVELIRYVLADLFQKVERAEQSIDAVTRLPGRRYLPAVLAREIDEHGGSRKRFSILLLRPPTPAGAGFKDSNSSRDIYLQQFASTLVSTIRPGDHLFRYHDDQFLVVAVEKSQTQADTLATQIQFNVRANHLLAQPGALGFGVRIGIAEFDGHPDFDYLLRRAERALVEAIGADEADAIAHC